MKCSECQNQAFPHLDAQAVQDHLEGNYTIGTYAIREDDTCTFLASDFDGDGWKQDVAAYKIAARELGIQVEIERSRSGKGAHAWIFFEKPIEARIARQLGTVIVARAQASLHTMSLGTYDRFFPNQDTLPKGGFGNLIALPLQKAPRDLGSSVFLADDFSPHSKQWTLLAGVRRLGLDEVRCVLNRELSNNAFQLTRYDDTAVASAEQALDSGGHKIFRGSFTGQIEIDVGCRLSIKTLDLPSSLLWAFKRTATCANPVFFKKQRLRFSTWNVPQFIFCGEIFPDRLLLPRGSLDACLDIKGDVTQQYKYINQIASPADIAGAAAFTRVMSYDGLGRLTFTRDERFSSNNRQVTYDALGRISTVTVGLNTKPATTRYFYDAHDNLSRVTDPDGRSTDYFFDDFDQLVAVKSPDSGTTLYMYNLAGDLIQKQDSAGTITTYALDVRHRLLTETSSMAGRPIRQYFYDAPAAPTATCGSGLQFEQDFVAGRLSAVIHDAGVTFVSVEDSPGFLPPPATRLPGVIPEPLPYGYTYNNPLGDTDESGEGVIGCVICVYYMFKCGDDIADCRAHQPAYEEGTGASSMAGVSFANIEECAKTHPCVAKMLKSCVSCGFVSHGRMEVP